MNFKDVYKSSNDCIKADRKLMEDIFKKSEKTTWFNYRKLAISCAAVLVCFVVGSLFAKQGSPVAPDTNPVYNEPVQKNKTVIAQIETEETKLQSEDSTDKNAAYKSADNIPPETAEAEIPQIASDNMAGAEIFSLPRMASGGSSGASNATHENISLEEYGHYAGVDILSITAQLPEGMHVVLPSEIIFEKDAETEDIISDYVQFVALDNDNPNKIIMTELTKTDGEISAFFDANADSAITIDNHDVVVTTDDSVIKSCFKHNDLWVLITSTNVSKEEFDTFLNSLLKKEN